MAFKLNLNLNRGDGLKLGKKGVQGQEVEVAPVFESLFGEPPAEPMANPLDAVTVHENPEETCAEETSTILQAIIAENEARRDAYRTMVDPEYWVCICFQNRAQKERFLEAVGWADLGDKYIDGLAVAERLGAGIEPEPVKIRAPKGLSKRLAGIQLIGEK